jgi:hypothetical protein
MVNEENLGLLLSTLGIFGITPKLIHSLCISDILVIRSSQEHKRFLQIYRDLLRNVCSVQEDEIYRIKRRISSQFHKEKIHSSTYNSLKYLQSASATIFTGLLVNYFSDSRIFLPAAMGSMGFAIVPQILKKLGVLNEQMTSKPFVEFKEYILGEKYKTAIYNGFR